VTGGAATGRPLRVLVAGGGVAGLEGALALRDLAGDRVSVSLLAPAEHFSYRPFSVARPFGLGQARQVPLAGVARDLGLEWTRDALAEVDDDAGRVRTAGGADLDFDALLVAVGAKPVAAVEHALTWWPEGDPEAFGGLLRDLQEGYVKRVAFVVPPGAVWPLPTYELALMTMRDAAGMGMSPEVVVTTPETEPLAFLGEEASGAIRRALTDAGIALHTGAPGAVRGGSPPAVELGPGEAPLEVDRVVAVPRVVGPAIAGLPGDEDGFVLVDEDGRVEGARRTWAAGDGVAFPIKFGGLATQQARRAAGRIARAAGAEVPPAEPLTLSGVLMTGGSPRALGEATGAKPQHVPLWWPAGKIAGQYLPRYLGERDDAPPPAEEAPVPAQAVRVERRLDLRGAEATWLYDVTRPLRASGSRAIGDLGRRVGEERRRLHPED
jgi:sulfide:quinone oxidoreductase